jgi:hypothetical protein
MNILAPDRDRLAASSDEAKRTVEIVWSAYRSVLSKEGRLAYVSTAITSGRRMWEAVLALGLRDADELKARFPEVLRDDVILPNVAAGNELAREVAAKIDHPVVAPAIFEARKQRWGQDEYMALWLKMIEENVGRIYMAPGWEFSNGGAEEYLHAVQMALGFRGRHDITPLDAESRVIPVGEGADAIARALFWLEERGAKAPVLAQVYCSLVTVLRLWLSPELGPELPKKGAYDAEFLRISQDHPISTLKEASRLLELDYGVHHVYLTATPDGGVPRSSDATPEGIVLKAEEPPT